MAGELIRIGLEGAFPSSEKTKMTLHDEVSALYEELRREIYRYLVLFGLPPAHAQEITQDAFLKFYAERRAGKTVDSPRAWLLRVAHNAAINNRLAERAGNYTTLDEVEPVRWAGKSPEQAAVERQRSERLREAMESLSAQQRSCLQLRAEGFRYREIAGILGISTSTVGEFLRRAIERIRKGLYE